MLNAIKSLLDSGIINEATRTEIQEAWETQVTEAKEQVRAELREEFARRYEHDKSVMVEALDKLVTENLARELEEFAKEQQALREDRVNFKRHMVESAGKFNDFMVSKLAEEIKELRKDRKLQQEAIAKLEGFVVEALAEEIKDFAQDKKQVVEMKVKLVAEAKSRLAELQKKFVSRASGLVKETVQKSLEAEIGQLKEDIHAARENMFGRRIFEAFASEFSVTHLNENKQIRKLMGMVEAQNKAIAEAKKAAADKTALVESKDREIRIIKESTQRQAVMGQLLKSLNPEKSAIMQQLLENVQTDKLKTAFEKYLPAVLTNSKSTVPVNTGRVLTEGLREMTGDKSANTTAGAGNNGVSELKRLAGLK